MSRIVSDVNRPKLSRSFAFRRRSILSATVASSIAALMSAGSRGRTVTDSPVREPKILSNAPSGMTTKSSCDWPKIEPFLALTPTTRKCLPAILMTLSTGLSSPKSFSAVSQPRSATGRLRSTSAGVNSRPRSASNVWKKMYSRVTPWIRTLSSSLLPKLTCVEPPDWAMTAATLVL